MYNFEEIKTHLGNSDTYYLIAVDMESNYSYLNQRYAKIFEPMHGSLVGKNYGLTIHPEDKHICQEVSVQAFGNRDAVFPATVRKLDGRGGVITTRWDYKAMYNESDEPNGIFCIGHDISELKQMTEELDQIKINHSHAIRIHVANLIGLGNLIQLSNAVEDIEEAAKLIVQSAKELDVVVRELHAG